MNTDTPSGEEETPSEPRRRGRPRRSDSKLLLEIAVPLPPEAEAEAVQQEVLDRG